VRWTEWGLQAYFRLLLGLAFILFSIATARARIVAYWVAGLAIIGALAYMAIGIAVGYPGLEKPGGFVQLLFFVFMVAVLVAGLRRRDSTTSAPA